MQNLTPNDLQIMMSMDKESLIKAMKAAELECRKRQAQNLTELVKLKLIKPEHKLRLTAKYLAEMVAAMLEYKKSGKKDTICYLTTSDKIIKRRDELQNIFNIQIKTPEESIPILEKEYNKQLKKEATYIG